MRRIAILGALVAVGVLVVRARGAKLRERLMAHCEGMFERMPDTVPPDGATPETDTAEEAHDAA